MIADATAYFHRKPLELLLIGSDRIFEKICPAVGLHSEENPLAGDKYGIIPGQVVILALYNRSKTPILGSSSIDFQPSLRGSLKNGSMSSGLRRVI